MELLIPQIHRRYGRSLVLILAGHFAGYDEAAGVVHWEIESVVYKVEVRRPGALVDLHGSSWNNDILELPTSFQGKSALFDTNLDIVALKTPADLDQDAKDKAEALIDLSVSGLGTVGTLLAALLKGILPLGEIDVFADGDLIITGRVWSDNNDEKLVGFGAESKGLVYSAGLFADAILGDGLPANEVDLGFAKNDFAYKGDGDVLGYSEFEKDYRFDPVGGGFDNFAGTASFEFQERSGLSFTVKHSMGGELGEFASAADYPYAGVFLDDLKLYVETKLIPSPAAAILAAIGIGIARRMRRGRPTSR